MFSKYQIELLSHQVTNPDDQQRKYFHDFDDDGESERILWGMNSFSRVPYINFFNQEDLLVREWNCPGEWVKDSPVIFGDYDQNSKDEIYGFTYLNDSIYLNGVEPYGNWNFEIKKKFICDVKKFNDNHVWAIFQGKVTDLNGDGYGEIVFPINSGYALQPRAVFAYDIFNDTVFRTPFFGAAVADISFIDFDNDNLDEVIVNTTSPANYKEPVPFSDTCSWVMVLNNDLKFYFEPISFPGSYGGISNQLIYKNGNPVIFSHHSTNSAINKTNELYLFDLKGNLITNKKPEFYFGSIHCITRPINKPSELLYILDKNVFQLDANLNIKRIKTLKFRIKSRPWLIELDNDDFLYYLFSTTDGSKMVIYREDFSNPVIIDKPPHNKQIVTVKHSKHYPALICINSERSYSIYEYRENPYYYFKYPSYLLLYILLFGFFHILFLFQKQRIKKIYETERR
ncbi:MAG: hypothetical protein K8R74_10660, partial [Bacteroidales bacterium]|nr:hypothetical protein [Bacteroidales bacterium]